MNNQYISAWLAKHHIILEESFAQSLTGLAMAYQRQKGIRNLNDVYKLIGVRKQLLAYWRNNPSGTTGTQTKKF